MVPSWFPPPPRPPARWNDCKGLAPLAEEPTDFSVRSLSLFSPACSETRFWSAPHLGPDPARAAASSSPLDIDSPWILASAWPVVRRWRPSSVSSLPACCSLRSANVSPVLCAVLKWQRNFALIFARRLLRLKFGTGEATGGIIAGKMGVLINLSTDVIQRSYCSLALSRTLERLEG